MTTVLAIDQGTSGTKSLVVDAEGRVLGQADRPVRCRYLPDGGVEQDPGELLDSVLASGRAALEDAGQPADLVTLANQGESVLAWDPTTGEPLSNLVVWQDRRSTSICDELVQHRELIQHRSGLVLDPYFSAPKQTWLRRHVTRDGVVTTSDSWLVHQLSGELVTDVATASRSLVSDLDGRRWDDELLGLFGLGDEWLPRIVDNDEVIGISDAFGRPLAVGGLIVDQQAALLGEDCRSAGDAKCTFGTGAFLLANTGETPNRSESGLCTSVAWTVRGRTSYCADGQVYAAATAVRWLERLGFIDSAADLDARAADNAGGVLAVPALAGLAAPWWQPGAKAVFTGMTPATGAGELILAVLQGIAAQVAELTSLVAADQARQVTRLRVDGGLTQCRTLMQSVADLVQCEIEVYPSTHATAMGATILGRLAHDQSLTVSEAAIAWQPSLTYTPLWSADRAADFRTRWSVAAAVAAREDSR